MRPTRLEETPRRFRKLLPAPVGTTSGAFMTSHSPASTPRHTPTSASRHTPPATSRSVQQGSGGQRLVVPPKCLSCSDSHRTLFLSLPIIKLSSPAPTRTSSPPANASRTLSAQPILTRSRTPSPLKSATVSPRCQLPATSLPTTRSPPPALKSTKCHSSSPAKRTRSPHLPRRQSSSPKRSSRLSPHKSLAAPLRSSDEQLPISRRRKVVRECHTELHASPRQSHKKVSTSPRQPFTKVSTSSKQSHTGVTTSPRQLNTKEKRPAESSTPSAAITLQLRGVSVEINSNGGRTRKCKVEAGKRISLCDTVTSPTSTVTSPPSTVTLTLSTVTSPPSTAPHRGKSREDTSLDAPGEVPALCPSSCRQPPDRHLTGGAPTSQRARRHSSRSEQPPYPRSPSLSSPTKRVKGRVPTDKEQAPAATQSSSKRHTSPPKTQPLCPPSLSPTKHLKGEVHSPHGGLRPRQLDAASPGNSSPCSSKSRDNSSPSGNSTLPCKTASPRRLPHSAPELRTTIRLGADRDEILFSTPAAPSLPLATAGRICRWRGCRENVRDVGDLLSHLQSHLGLGDRVLACRWTGCKVFGRPFKRSAALSLHLSLHCGPRPFRCSACALLFSTQLQLCRHLASHSSPRRRSVALATPQPEQVIFRRSEGVRHSTDAIDSRVLELVELSLEEEEGLNVKLTSEVIGSRQLETGVRELLLHWTPQGYSEDEWVSHLSASPQKHIRLAASPRAEV